MKRDTLIGLLGYFDFGDRMFSRNKSVVFKTADGAMHHIHNALTYDKKNNVYVLDEEPSGESTEHWLYRIRSAAERYAEKFASESDNVGLGLPEDVLYAESNKLLDELLNVVKCGRMINLEESNNG